MATSNAAKKKAKEASAPEAAPELVDGVITARVVEKVLHASLVQLGLCKSPAEAKKVGLAAGITLLKGYYTKHTAEQDLAGCDNCEGPCDVRLDSCPYCGAGSEDDKGKGAPAQPAGEEKDGENVKTAKADKKGKGDDEAKGGKEDKALATVAKLPAGVTVSKLDHAVARIIAQKGETGASMWRLGKEIKELYDGELWKARVGDGGNPAYKHWNQFCAAELGMSPANTYNLMDVAKAFTEEKVRKMGTSKLALVLKAPPEDQPRLLDLAEQGKSKRDIQREVTAAKEEKGHRRQNTGRKKTPAAPKKLASQITVANILKTVTVPLYKKPDKGQQPDKRAKRLADEPVGWFDLGNGVRQFFAITESATSGELSLKVVTKRVDE